MEQGDIADFGYQKLTPAEKGRRVKTVFDSVASRYDLMNNLMSWGVHHFWKRYALYIAPIVKPGAQILDLASGTADMSILLKKKSPHIGHLTLCDINADMLTRGRDRLLDRGMLEGIGFTQGSAEALPFAGNCFDLIVMAFGLRNVTDKRRALRSIYEQLNYGGVFLIIEFSKLKSRLLTALYDRYSFNVIPWLGKKVAGDEPSYRYLVESIRMHPDQGVLEEMLRETGFDKVDHINLTAGVVAIHRGYKL